MKLFCIGDEDTVRGFGLAGVAGRAVGSAEEARTALEEAAGRAECGLIIMTEKVANKIRPQVEEIRFERSRPVIVEISGPEGGLGELQSLHRMVQQAVGLHLGQKGD